jgi:peptide subunit release factor 1 (eRF1)
MELTCPKCHQKFVDVSIQKQNYHCSACNSDFKLHFTCDKCGDELELLQACGAANLWCNRCNELKSKSSSPYTLKEI